jgi:hypothetical protein
MNFIVMLGMLGSHFQIINSYGDVILMGSYRMGNGQTLTLSPVAPFAPPCPTALGLIGPRKMEQKSGFDDVS